MIILLDAGPLGLASNPKPSPVARSCNGWIEELLAVGARVAVPEVTDYEVRRELIRSEKWKGIERLDNLKVSLTYVPLTTGMMLQAAEFWAAARNAGKPTADPQALDCDVVLAAQAVILSREWASGWSSPPRTPSISPSSLMRWTGMPSVPRMSVRVSRNKCGSGTRGHAHKGLGYAYPVVAPMPSRVLRARPGTSVATRCSARGS